ncbi:MAG: CoA transferase [bacterium]|nr:CoA transferase [Deltaproteobacteria bacterium]MCP4905141.1 CoA transferase [bacterium]
MPDPLPRPKPLAGIKVVDCTRVLSGPICGRMLSDMGADVVKIEAPESDILRSTTPLVGGFGSMFAQYNVGKRNVSIDLKQPGGPEILAELAGEADVLVENFRPGVLARLGLAPETLRAANPRLVFCSISGWGQDGPWAAEPAYAPMIQAQAGTLAMSGRLRKGRMRGETMQHADLYAGMMACQGILAALFHRERTGQGQHIDVSMGEALLYVNEHASAEIAGYDGADAFPTWSFETFVLANGRAVHLMGLPEMIFPLLAAAIPIPGALDDPRFTTPEKRVENREALITALETALATVADGPTLERLLADTPIVAVAVRSTRELADSDWARHRELLTEAAPGLQVPTAPWRAGDLEIGPPTPHIAKRGEHNQEVLAEWLDKDATVCAELEAIGVLEFSEEEPPTLEEAPRVAFREPDASR